MGSGPLREAVDCSQYDGSCREGRQGTVRSCCSLCLYLLSKPSWQRSITGASPARKHAPTHARRQAKGVRRRRRERRKGTGQCTPLAAALLTLREVPKRKGQGRGRRNGPPRGRDAIKKKISQPTGSTGRVPRFEPNDRTGKGGTRESLCRAADEGMRRPPGATEQ